MIGEVFTALIGLVLFLYGIEHFSKEIQYIVGDRFRKVLKRATNNRFLGAFVGASITALIQSSTATTIISIGLVNAGAIAFSNTLPVLIGANIGTTITAQLTALKVTSFAPPLIILGFILSLFRRSQLIGKALFYFGLLFYGLTVVNSAIAPYQNDPMIISLFVSISYLPIAFIVGLIFTAIVQSSSITTGLVVLLAQNNLISLPQGIAILLGANIGTTVTGLLASARMSIFAKRAAYAHLIFNVVGSILMFPFINQFAAYVTSLGGSLSQQMANAHTIFNVIAAIVFLIFITQYKKIIEELVTGEEKEILFETKFLNDKLPEDNAMCFNHIQRELKYGISVTRELFERSVENIKNLDEQEFRQVYKLEQLSDFLDEKIEKAIIEFSERDLNKTEIDKTIKLVRISNSIEQLSDLAIDLIRLAEKARDQRIALSDKAIDDITELFGKFTAILRLIEVSFPKKANQAKLGSMQKSLEKSINNKFNEHIKRLKEVQGYSGVIFVESVNILENSNSKIFEIKNHM